MTFDLEAKLLEVPLGTGLDESVDPAYTPMTRMQACSNVVFQDVNTAAKRQGLTQLATLANARKLAALGNEVLAIDGLNAWSYQTSQGGFVARGPVSPCMVSRKLFAGAGANPGNGTQIVPLGAVAEDPITGLRVYVWNDGNTVQTSIYDVKAKSFVQTATTMQTTCGDLTGSIANQPRVLIPGGTRCFIFFWDYLASKIAYQSIDLANIAGGWTALTDIGSPVAMTATDCFDVKLGYTQASNPNLSETIILLGWILASGPSVKLSMLRLSGTSLPLITTATVATPANWNAWKSITVAGSLPVEFNTGPVAMIAYAYNTLSGGVTTAHLHAASFSFTRLALTPITADTSFISQAIAASNGPGEISGVGLVKSDNGIGTAGNYMMTYTETYLVYLTSTTTSFSALQSFSWQTITPFFSVTNSVANVLGYQTASNPIRMTVNGTTEIYVLLMWQDGIPAGTSLAPGLASVTLAAQTLVLVNVNAASSTAIRSNPVAVMAPRFAGYARPGNVDVAYFGQSGTNGFTLVGSENEAGTRTSLTSAECNFLHPGLWQSVSIGDWTYLAAGLPMIYDGNQLCEAGFINQPPGPPVSLTSGSLVIPKISTLTYTIVYTQQDAHGNVHRSPPSVATIVDASGANYASAKLRLANLQITLRQTFTNVVGQVLGGGVMIEVYRNNSGAGTTVNQLIATLPNDPSQPYQDHTDIVPDGNAGTGGIIPNAPILYTTGGQLPSDGPPNLSALATHADRIFGISEDGVTAYYTSSFIRGAAPAFSDAFTITWPEGHITAQWSLESRFHAATNDQIWFVFGDGPTGTGAGNDLTLPQLWQADFGVVDARGLALFQGGALLWTKRGWYLEDRAGSYSWVGERVQRTLGQTNPTLTSIVPLETVGAIRITSKVTDAAGSAGAIIHWDYRHDRFASHSSTQSGLAACGCASAVVAGGVWYGLFDGSGTPALVKEDSTTNLDNGAWVMSSGWTGWFHPEGMQAFMRINRVLVFSVQNTPSGVTVQPCLDYGGASGAAGTWTDTDLSGLSNVQVEFTAGNQKCQAVSFQWQDNAPATLGLGIGTGMTWKNLQARIRLKRGENKNLIKTERR